MKYYLIFTLTLFFTLLAFTQTEITFLVKHPPKVDFDQIGIRGNTLPLSWETSKRLTAVEEGYTVTLNFPKGVEKVEFKFVYRVADKLTWEGIENRNLVLKPGTMPRQEFSWDQEQKIDINTLSMLEPTALLADFELIETMVREVHPGTYRYNDEQQVNAALEKLRTKFSTPLSYGDAYAAISELTATLQCDHTKAGFNNQGAVINSIIHWQADKLPFTFKWIDEEMIIVYNASNSENLSRGTAVRKINGVDVKELRDEIIKYIGADGATDGNRLYKAAINGYDFRYNAFDIFFPLLYPMQENSVWLELEPYEADEIMLTKVVTLTREDRADRLNDSYPEFPYTRDDLWSFEIVADSIGILTMNTFGLQGWKAMTLDYKQFLAETFATIQRTGIQHLVLDIRENTGGADEMADELFSYLAATKVSLEREGRTRYLTFPESLKPFLKTWGNDDPWYYNLNPEDPKPTDGYYLFKDNFTASAKKSDKTIYQGNTYLLTSPANTSLAFYTALRFQKQKLGTIIGQETGGNLNDINGGQILFLRLPNSGIEIDFPVMGGFTTEPQSNMGVQPDVEVHYQRKDIVAKRDVEMEAVLEIINN